MPRIRIGTFNCENLFLRYNFTGPLLRRRKGESQTAFQNRQRAARAAALQTFGQTGGPPEWIARDLENISTTSHTQRRATAAVIRENHPDIMALVEVECMDALRRFNSAAFFGDNRYAHALLIDGNDPRGIDVAVLSNFPITRIRTHIDDTSPGGNGRPEKIFSRDCLEVTFDISGTPLTLYVNHLKSQYRDNPARRLLQAQTVAELIQERFGPGANTGLFAVVGDFNQVPGDASLAPLTRAAWLTGPIADLPPDQQWTHVYESGGRVRSVSQLDYILLSQELASRHRGGAIIERRGLARYSGLNAYYPDTAPRILRTVGAPGTEASDHCPVFVDIEV
jgi:endonuclease/exonuclease/phosphatase family metal-dependent hydrolase